MKRLSVIIVTFRNIEIIKNCLDSIYRYNDIGDELEVIISDNTPDYSVYDFVKQNYPSVELIKNDNIGFGAGNNKGADIAKGEYLLFLNPDTLLIEPVFRFAIDCFDDNRELVMFGMKILDANRKQKNSFFLIDRDSILWNTLLHFCWKFDIFIPKLMYIAGADIFIRKDVFEQAGRFDENIFMYQEEPDLVRRIRGCLNNPKIRYFKHKRIIHLEGGTEEKNINSKIASIRRMYDTEKYYTDKWKLDILKIYKDKLRHQKLKGLIYKITGSVKYKNQKTTIDEYQRIVDKIKVYNENIRK